MSSTGQQTSTELLQKRQFLSKLKNMRETLNILLKKKVRLEFEIRNLKKAIKTKTKNYEEQEKLFRLNVGLEGNLSSELEPGLSDSEEELRALEFSIEEEIAHCRNLFEPEALDDFIQKLLSNPDYLDRYLIEKA